MLRSPTTSMAGKWSGNLPVGSVLVRTEIVTGKNGERFEVQVYDNPFRGSFQVRTLLNPNRKPILVPVNPLRTIQGTRR